MKAVVLTQPAPIDTAPLQLRRSPHPRAGRWRAANPGARLWRVPYRLARRRRRSPTPARPRRPGSPGGRSHRCGSVPGCRRGRCHRVGIAVLRETCGTCARLPGAATRTCANRRASPAGMPTAGTPSTRWYAKTSPTPSPLRSTMPRRHRCCAPASSAIAPCAAPPSSRVAVSASTASAPRRTSRSKSPDTSAVASTS